MIWLLAPSRAKFPLFLSIPACVAGRPSDGGQVAKSYDRKKAWSSINHSILSAWAEGTICKFKLNSQNIFIVIVVLSFHLWVIRRGHFYGSWGPCSAHGVVRWSFARFALLYLYLVFSKEPTKGLCEHCRWQNIDSDLHAGKRSWRIFCNKRAKKFMVLFKGTVCERFLPFANIQYLINDFLNFWFVN